MAEEGLQGNETPANKPRLQFQRKFVVEQTMAKYMEKIKVSTQLVQKKREQNKRITAAMSTL